MTCRLDVAILLCALALCVLVAADTPAAASVRKRPEQASSASDDDAQPQPEAESRFARTLGRQWRFDWAFVDEKVAVAVEGNAWSTKGGGRHGTDKDREKMNAAVELGWKVFRYSPQMLERDPWECCVQVLKAVEDGD